MEYVHKHEWTELLAKASKDGAVVHNCKKAPEEDVLKVAVNKVRLGGVANARQLLTLFGLAPGTMKP